VLQTAPPPASHRCPVNWPAARVTDIFERWESQAALETLSSSGHDTKQRRAMLTVSVQGYDIADVLPCSGRGKVTCGMEPRSTDELRASVRS
jgi:hypothetical protein